MEKAQELGIDFVPCSGWLSRFKRQHGIIFKAISISGEAASVDMSTVETWRGSALKELLQLYKPDDIFNADERDNSKKTVGNSHLSHFPNKGGEQNWGISARRNGI
ncbi:hypothetical protein RRG08_004529 [Elysia crispata]|uniref:HTH CENPB-type domain-containing protein n=1 Tax=Elysia crispata TaxID=231223 RepID=A0AAE1BAG5_9GAST|nr:hypothetical protein RRG08_004529 [Elysia crispata]